MMHHIWKSKNNLINSVKSLSRNDPMRRVWRTHPNSPLPSSSVQDGLTDVPRDPGVDKEGKRAGDDEDRAKLRATIGEQEREERKRKN